MSTEDSYDAIADEYVARIYDELRHKPLDRALLDELAAHGGPLCDVGCGPGQVARYLHDRAQACGVDLSGAMVARARALNPGIEFVQADLRAMPFADAHFAGLAAFYSLIHVPRAEQVPALRELRRVLRPGGRILVAVHVGDHVVHLDAMWDRPVSLDFVFFGGDEMASYLRAAGFTDVTCTERDPYPDVEHPSRRAYLFATR